MRKKEENIAASLEEDLIWEIIVWTLKKSKESSFFYIIETVVSQLNIMPNERELAAELVKNVFYKRKMELLEMFPKDIIFYKKIKKFFELNSKEYFDFDFSLNNYPYVVLHKIPDQEKGGGVSIISENETEDMEEWSNILSFSKVKEDFLDKEFLNFLAKKEENEKESPKQDANLVVKPIIDENEEEELTKILQEINTFYSEKQNEKQNQEPNETETEKPMEEIEEEELSAFFSQEEEEEDDEELEEEEEEEDEELEEEDEELEEEEEEIDEELEDEDEDEE
ncbi:MAG: hypothetical protein N3A54_03305 [Patescibacteria group bacterium]|nr:hypothetical protein [Patescibacteria group bacterium]